MEMKWICSLILTSSLITLSCSPTWAAEEPYPNRPLNIVINYTPGGVMDLHAKIIGDYLTEALGQPMVKVHKPGGGGTVGASFAARAKPDGYTLFTGTSNVLVFIPLLKKVDYKWEEFIPLGAYAKGIISLYVRADSKWKTLRDFVKAAKEQQLKVATPGKMTQMDFVLEVFARQAGIKLVHVPYKSCGETVTALLGGHVDADICPSSMGQIQAGAVKMLAVADHERSKYMPDIKTFKEEGYQVAFPLWYSFCVPQKTPKRIVDKLLMATQGVFKQYEKEIQERLLKMETLPFFMDSQQTMDEFKKDHAVMSKTVTDLGYYEK